MHFADLFEAVADAVGEQPALVNGAVRRTWSELDDRSARLASAMQNAGLQPDSKIGFFLYNGNEYVEAYFAALKIRGVAVNINYRYREKELQYLLDYADAEALFFHRSLSAVVAEVVNYLPKLKLLIEIDDGGISKIAANSYESLIESNLPAARIERSNEDNFMNFTGGTTGYPKGVVYRMGDVTEFYLSSLPSFFGSSAILNNCEDLAAFAKELSASPMPPVSLPACPLMHTAGLMNGLLTQMLCGAKIVTMQNRSFDAYEMLEAIERERVTFSVIVGDAFCRPILEALDKALKTGRTFDLSSLKFVMSSGVAWSLESKQKLLKFADAYLIDAMGATEGGMGMSICSRAIPPVATGKFGRMPDTKLFSEDNREIEPGSNEIGYIAAGGKFVPIAYYKDPEKSAKTFRTIGGKRYSLTGDMGTIDADGTLNLLGRGSGCINTAGEKVFAEEVESVLNRHDAVVDCLVVGAPHERFGQCVAAVVALSSDAPADANMPGVLQNYCKQEMAGYKCPRIIKFVDEIVRGANGKPDYKWAEKQLEKA
tara:strand:+ start:1801 stop:3426 length:1626 start_codon:yes stop_codon:yes gene_type:complete